LHLGAGVADGVSSKVLKGVNMRMNYWKARLNAVWCEVYGESAEEVFDAWEAVKIIEKGK